MLKKFMLSAGLVALIAGQALAMSAPEAKNAGLIKEDCQGYVQALKPEGQSVATDINAKRREEYQRLAAEQKLPVDVVAKTTGAKLCGQ